MSAVVKTVLLLMFGYCTTLAALPAGAHNIQGEVAIKEEAHSLAVHSNGKAIIHWDTFDIASNQRVAFEQAQNQAAILNRVTGGQKSYILGRLSANCPLFIVNEKGIVFGSTAQVETAGLIASTADISNECFWGEGDVVFEGLREGSIVNLGKITSTQGDIVLIARSIENQGNLESPQKSITLTTTEMVIDSGTKQKVHVRLGEEPEPEKGIQNEGNIQALSIDLKTHSPYESAIRHRGNIEATSAKEENGRIYLVADHGGIDINASISAPDGSVYILGKSINIKEQAEIDVSSESRGGTILIGGDFQGKNSYADKVHVKSEASLLANATDKGNGGEIAIWSEEETIFHGKAEARGGPNGGNGGKIEISTHGSAYEVGSKAIIDLSAPKGKKGSALFDPKYVYIEPGGADLPLGQSFSKNPEGTACISGITLATTLDTADVVIQANTDIVFMDTVEAKIGNSNLELQAGRSIRFIDGHLSLNNGEFHAIINTDSGLPQAGERDPGLASFSMDGSSILTKGNDISVNVGTFGGVQAGEFYIDASSIDAGGGSIDLTGYARQDGTDSSQAIFIGSFCEIKTSGVGEINISGTGGIGASGNNGIYLSGITSLIETELGAINLTGFGGGNGTGVLNHGIISGCNLKSKGSGPIHLNGTSGTGSNMNMGIYLQGGNIEATDGSILLTGLSQGTGKLNFGVRLESGSKCTSTGNEPISILGTSGNGTENNHGVILTTSTIETATAPILVQGKGQGLGDYNYGLRMETGSIINSTDTATVSLEGTNLSGQSCSTGISIANEYGGIYTKDGDMILKGLSNGTGIMNQGVSIEGGIVQSTGLGDSAGNIQIVGVGGSGEKHSDGVYIVGLEHSNRVTSVDGDITLNGTAIEGNSSIYVNPPNCVNTTGSGNVDFVTN